MVLVLKLRMNFNSIWVWTYVRLCIQMCSIVVRYMFLSQHVWIYGMMNVHVGLLSASLARLAPDVLAWIDCERAVRLILTGFWGEIGA